MDSAVVERRGCCWAMTSFGEDACKASEKDLLAEGLTLHGYLRRRHSVLALNEREKAILRMKADGMSEYKIARKLEV